MHIKDDGFHNHLYNFVTYKIQIFLIATLIQLKASKILFVKHTRYQLIESILRKIEHFRHLLSKNIN
jgi:hypothetical protein